MRDGVEDDEDVEVLEVLEMSLVEGSIDDLESLEDGVGKPGEEMCQSDENRGADGA